MVIAGQAAMTQARRAALAVQAASIRSGHATAEDGDLSYYTVHDVSLGDHVRPMFGCTWAAFLAVFSVILETAGDEDARAINACLVGFAQVRSTSIR